MFFQSIDAVAEIHFVRWGGHSLLNFRQNFQISDIPPPPFALEKTVFSPLLDQNFRKFVNFPEGGGGGRHPRPTKISATA